jgi:hypothetical protein
MELPLPNGAYWWGVGPAYVYGYSPVVEEWSASKSPYYTYGDPVLYKGLVYYLNYAWDGTTVGAPDSQIDGDGNRTWSLWCGNGRDQYYTQLQLKNLLNGPTVQWGLRPCHTLFYTLFNDDLSLCMQRDANPKAYDHGSSDTATFSIDVGAELSIPANLFKFVQTDGASHPSSDVGSLVGGIFDSLKDYPYTYPSRDPLGALYHEESFNYTLTEKNWWMNPEYDDSGASNRTFTYTDTFGTTVNRTKLMWMIFVPHTFKDRTYNGAFRVYKKFDNPSVLIERFELDSVTPDLITD